MSMRLLCLILCASPAALAQTIPLQNLNEDDYDAVAHEFAAAGLFSAVNGAGTLGRLFGFEVGALGSLTNVPNVHRLARDADPKANVKQLPMANLYLGVTVPLGLTVEGAFLPRLGGKDYRVENFALAMKWTPTELFFDLPLDVAVRAQVVKTSLQFHALVDDVATHVAYDGKLSAFEGIVSKNFGILTPYVGLGGASGSGEMNADGARVFDPSFRPSQSASARPSGAIYRAGLEIHVLILTAGVEYERALGTDRFNAKLAAGF